MSKQLRLPIPQLTIRHNARERKHIPLENDHVHVVTSSESPFRPQCTRVSEARKKRCFASTAGTRFTNSSNVHGIYYNTPVHSRDALTGQAHAYCTRLLSKQGAGHNSVSLGSHTYSTPLQCPDGSTYCSRVQNCGTCTSTNVTIWLQRTERNVMT